MAQEHPPLTTPPSKSPVEVPAAAAAPEAEAAAEEAPAEPQPLEPSVLVAAVSEAMVMSGLGNKANLVETVLLSAMGRFVDQGSIDLGLLWRILVTDMFQPKDKTAQTMLLTAIYVAKTFQVPVAVPQEAQDLMETLLPSEEERTAAGERLEAAVAARLNRTRMPSTQPAATAVSTSGKGVAASGKHGPGVSSSGGAKGAAKSDVPTLHEMQQGKGKGKGTKRRIDLNNPVVGVISGLVFLCTCIYWTNELVVKEIQLDKKRQAYFSKRPIDAAALPQGVEVKEAFVIAATLKVHLADDKLAKMPDKERAQIAADLLASAEKVGAMRLTLFSDAKRYLVNKDLDGLVTVQIVSSD